MSCPITQRLGQLNFTRRTKIGKLDEGPKVLAANEGDQECTACRGEAHQLWTVFDEDGPVLPRNANFTICAADRSYDRRATSGLHLPGDGSQARDDLTPAAKLSIVRMTSYYAAIHAS
ncbi:hypothetical protein RGCCGE502_17075 [Rhizobium grahamii CCGE 502]|uniref:Uncharacterized protein n=1 Tax=Rhizobium grahamii CCGE 502 TaxID=990285 RepID=S3HGB4_9HYPH|nr:hypothetical protein RGCCGE502_17075 [Rhizobium grahamii CCGE 502]